MIPGEPEEVFLDSGHVCEPQPGEMHEVDRAFYDLTVAQRNKAWADLERIQSALAVAITERELLRQVVAAGLVAFDLTRQYVGEEMLPALNGWSWFDWCKRAEAVL